MTPEKHIKSPDGVQIAYGCDDMVRQWVSRELGITIEGECRALGGVLNGRLIGGAVYNNYAGFMVDIHIATTDKRWCNRRVLKAVFEMAFDHLGCERMNMMCSKKNKPMRKLALGLGFKQEGTHRKAHLGTTDAISYGMLKSECRWIK
ncbi:GNAT family N-acetyltransferase [bacterium]|nr:GNAT family N-acetyltransferase [bacterium]